MARSAVEPGGIGASRQPPPRAASQGPGPLDNWPVDLAATLGRYTWPVYLAGLYGGRAFGSGNAATAPHHAWAQTAPVPDRCCPARVDASVPRGSSTPRPRSPRFSSPRPQLQRWAEITHSVPNMPPALQLERMLLTL